MNLTMVCRDLGVLPFAGGLLDQPAEIALVLEACIGYSNEKQQIEADKAKRNRPRGGQRAARH